jgi:hypothetical protein
MTEDTWSGEDIAFLVQVANQIAIAVENSLSYRELAEMKEPCYRKALSGRRDPPRSQYREHGGAGTRFPIRFEERSDRCATGEDEYQGRR